MTWFKLAGAYLLLCAVVIVLASGADTPQQSATTTTAAVTARPGFGPRQMAAAVRREKLHEDPAEEHDRGGEESGSEALSGAPQERYTSTAYPRDAIALEQTTDARRAYTDAPRTLPRSAFRRGIPYQGSAPTVRTAWNELGPIDPIVPADVTYTGKETTNSGRITAIAVDPSCDTTGKGCRVWVAAAGGGIWRTLDGLDATPVWKSVDTGLTTQSFSSLVVDPSDATGNTLYAGSGEGSGSSDSEAGLGLFKTTDGGDHWTLLSGSGDGVAADRSVYAIAIDPVDPQHIYIGTSGARHGSAGTNGGRRTPPNAPPLGVWETTDGGASFNQIFHKPGAAPGTDATGTDFNQGGITRLILRGSVLYASVNGYGIYRHGDGNDAGPSDLGGNDWHQIFTTGEPGAQFGRTEFDVTTKAGHTRIYVGDATSTHSQLYRVDDADVDADTLNASSIAHTLPWHSLSDSTADTTGFASYDYCQGQCDYDDFVVVDPSNPDIVYLGGSMNYDELVAFGSDTPRSNGRAVIRSTDAGVSFTDMTNDAGGPPIGMHPDQHAMAFDPANPDIWFVGSDGGMIRSDGAYRDGSSVCAPRGLTGAPLAFCQQVTHVVPHRLDNINTGLKTLQFQGLAVDQTGATDGGGDLMGGTQDNGTWAHGGTPTWFESIGGDGGQAAFSGDGARFHTYYGPSMDVSLTGTDPQDWLYVSKALDNADEAFAFYAPLIADPSPDAQTTEFIGGQQVWRTQDNGGDATFLTDNCGEYTTYDGTAACGDWVPLGGAPGNLSGQPLSTNATNFISYLGRSKADTGTLWAGMRLGKLYISKNADAANAADVTYTEIDGVGAGTTPGRFVSAIDVDPADPNHAFISYSGYGAYTPGHPEHLLEAHYDPTSHTATFTDRSYDLGDQPLTALAVDWSSGDVYAGTDFGVLRLPHGATAWQKAATGIPPTAVYDLRIGTADHLLYAGTHGRGVWTLRMPSPPAASVAGPSTAQIGDHLQFTATGTAYDGGPVTFAWHLPNGTTAAGPAASYTATTAGVQTVTMTATDQDSRPSVVSFPVTVRAPVTTTKTVTTPGRTVTTTKTVTVKTPAPPFVGIGSVKRGSTSVSVSGRGTARASVRVSVYDTKGHRLGKKTTTVRSSRAFSVKIAVSRKNAKRLSSGLKVTASLVTTAGGRATTVQRVRPRQ